MPGKLFNSPAQHLLVSMHRLVSPYVNLHSGGAGKVYRRFYFLYKRIIDRHLIAAARRLTKPGTLVLDIGANIGFFSVAMARQADVRVLAFEPDHQNYQGLNMVTTDYDLGARIQPYMLAVSDRTGTGSLYLSDLAPTDHKLVDSRSSRTIEITTTRLDDFFVQHTDHAKTPVSLVKVDVQGAELLVLRGMHQTLMNNNYPPILVEYSPDDLIHAGVAPREFFGAFEALGYRPHTLPEVTPRDPDWFVRHTHGAYTDLAMMHSLTSPL